MKINWKFVFNRFAWFIALYLLCAAVYMLGQVTLEQHIGAMSDVNAVSFFLAVLTVLPSYTMILIILHEADAQRALLKFFNK